LVELNTASIAWPSPLIDYVVLLKEVERHTFVQAPDLDYGSVSLSGSLQAV